MAENPIIVKNPTNYFSQNLASIGNPQAVQPQQAAPIFPTKIEEKEAKAMIPAAIKNLHVNGTIGDSFQAGTSGYNNPEVINFLNTDDAALAQYYGDEAPLIKGQLLSNIAEGSRVRNKETSLAEKAGVFATGVGQGVTNAVGGIGAFGAGLVNANAGAAVARGTTAISEALGNLRSDNAKAVLDQSNRIMGLQSEDADKEHDLYVAEHGESTMATLGRIGRGIGIAAKEIASNGTAGTDLLGQGVGSLIPTAAAAALSGGASVGVQGASLASRLAVAGTAMGMGAGEGYIGAQQDIQAMSHDELMAGSEDYKSLINSGESPEDAKNIIANRAGLLAGTIAAPINAAGAGLTHEFLANPLKVAQKAIGKGVVAGGKAAVKTVAKEGLEEAVQGGATQAATNLGIQQFADSNRSIFQDVGEQGALEGLGGIGTAGMTQGIGTARNILKRAATPKLVKEAQKATEASEALKAVVPTLTPAPATADPSTGEFKPSLAGFLQLNDRDNTLVQDLKTNGILAEDVNIQSGVGLAENLMGLLGSDKLSNEQKLAVTHTVMEKLNLLNEISELSDESLSTFSDDADTVKTVKSLATTFIKNEATQNVIKSLLEAEGQFTSKVDNITDDASLDRVVDSLSTNPEAISDANIKAVKDYVSNNEKTINPELKAKSENIIQNHEDIQRIESGKDTLKKNLKLTDQVEESAALATHLEVSPELKEFTKIAKNLGVSKELLETGNSKNGLPSVTMLKSMYSKAPTSKIRQNIADRVSNLITHMNNKLEAMDKSSSEQDIKPVAYDTLKKNGKFSGEGRGGSVYYNPKSAKSSYIYGSAILDTVALNRAYEDMQKANKDPNVVFKTPRTYAPQNVSNVSGLADIIKNNHPMTAPVTASEPAGEISNTRKVETSPEVEKAPVEASKALKITNEVSNDKDLFGEDIKRDDSTTEQSKPVQEEEPNIKTEPKTDDRQGDLFQENKSSEEKVQKTEKTEVKSKTPLAHKADKSDNSQTSERSSQQQQTKPTQEEKVLEKAEVVEELSEEEQAVSDDEIKETVDNYDIYPPKENRFVNEKYQNPFKVSEEAVKNNLVVSDFSNLKAHINEKFPDLSPKAKEKILTLMNKFVPFMEQNINEQNKALLKNKIKEVSNWKRIQDDEKLLETDMYKTALLVDKTTGEYAPAMTRAMSLAVLDALFTDDFTSYQDQLSKTYDLGNMDQEDVKNLVTTVSHENLVKEVSRRIKNQLHIKIDNNTPIYLGEGLINALASQAIDAAVAAQAIGHGKVEALKTDEKTKKVLNIPLTRYYKTDKFVNAYLNNENLDNNLLGTYSTVLDALTGKEDAQSFGFTPDVDGSPFIKNASHAKPSKKQVNFWKIQNSTPFTLNVPMLELFQHTGKDLRVILGHKNPSKNANIEYVKGIEGKNTSIRTGLNKVQEIINAMKATQGIDSANITPEQVLPVYFRSYMISSGRSMFESTNPQSNKFLRHLFLPNKTEYDLSKVEDNEAFFAGVLQGFGGKIQKVQAKDRAAAIEKILGGEPVLKEALDAIKAYQDVKSDENIAVMTEKLKAIQTITDEIPYTIHALNEYARYLTAKENGENNFSSDLFLEIDGMANGAAMNLLNFGTGNVDNPVMKQLYNSIGLYFEGDPWKNTQEYFADKNNLDLYEIAGNTVKEYFAQTYAEPEVKAIRTAGSILLNSMGIAEFSDASTPLNRFIEFNRGINKAPTMTYMYLSGEKAFAVKLYNDEIIPQLYSAIEDLRNGKYKTMYENPIFAGLSEAYVDELFYTSNGNYKPVLEQNFNKINEPSKTALMSIREAYSIPMHKTLDHLLGDSKGVIVKAAEIYKIQQEAIATMFKEALDEKLGSISDRFSKTLKKDFDEGTIRPQMLKYFTEHEIDTIRNDLIKEYGIITSNGIDLDVTKLENIAGDGIKSTYTNPLTGEQGTYFQEVRGIEQIEDTDVAMGAVWNIFHADHLTMLNAFNKFGEELGTKVLQVYDGINISPKDAAQVSNVLNEVISNDVMLRDNITPLIDAAQKLLTLPDTFLATQVKVRGGSKNETISREDIAKNIIKELEVMRVHNIQRKKTFEDIGYTVHQMVGDPEAYTKTGTNTFDLNNASIVSQRLMDTSAYSVNSNISQTLIGNDPKTYTTFSSQEAMKILEKNIYAAKETGELVKVLKKNAKNIQATEVFVGSKEAMLTKINEDRLLANQEPIGSFDTDGMFDLSTRKIYINSKAANIQETLLHEMVHAVTANKIDAYYNNNETGLSELDKSAILSLEKLYNEFEQAYMDDNATVLQDQIDDGVLDAIINAPDQATKIAEFAAYGLTNYNTRNFLKASKVKDVLLKIKGKIVAAVKALLGLNYLAAPGKDIFSNVKFHSTVLSASPYTGFVSQDRGSIAPLNHATEATLNRYRGLFKESLKKSLPKTLEANAEAQRLISDMRKSGFNMSAADEALYNDVYSVIAASESLNTRNRMESEKLLDNFLGNVKESDFANKAQYEFVMQNQSMGGKPVNSFAKLIALSQTSDEFRQTLNKIPLPKGETRVNSFDGWVDYVGNTILQKTDDLLVGLQTNKTNNTRALDTLTEKLGTQPQESVFDMTSNFTNGINTLANEKSSGLIQKMADIAFDTTGKISDKSSNKVIKNAANVGRIVAGSVSKKYGTVTADAITNYLNNLGDWSRVIQEFWAEIRGTTPTTANLVRLNKKAKGNIERVRQQFKEHFPAAIKQEFNNELTEAQYTDLYYGLGKTDVAVFEGADIGLALNDTKNQITKQAKGLSPEVIKAADALATYLATNELISNSLHRNAESIANTYNVRNQAEQIDKYITLKALEMTDPTRMDSLRDIYNKHPEATEKLLSIVRKAILDDKTKADNVYTGWKGYLPKENISAKRMSVFPTDQLTSLSHQGYTPVAPVEGTNGKYSYFYSSVETSSPIQQGALRFAQNTSRGASMHTGTTIGSDTSNRISLKGMAALNIKPFQNMVPVRDRKGKIIAYEFTIPNEYIIPDENNRNTNIADMIGTWIGRQKEEKFSLAANDTAIDILFDTYQNEYQKDSSNFVNLATSTDPVHRDMWDSMPQELRGKINKKFGEKNFYVRKDMVNNTIGYRSMSVRDIFNDRYNMDTPLKNIARSFAENLFGKNAYNILVKSENLLRSTVSTAKDIIVIRSVVVPVANMLSNVAQLMTAGVPIMEIVKGMNNKFKEIRQFTEQNNKILDLEFQKIGETNQAKLDVINKRIKLLKDSHRQMSIWPLIQAGEFTTISDSMKIEGESMLNGKWMDSIQTKLVDNTPKPLKTAMKQALMTKDTSLYKIMFAGTQYGDFLAKAIYYDHLTKNQKMSHDDAMPLVTDEFINYDSNPGRVRTLLDSIGLTWFWNYKIRSLKIAHRLLRDRPLAALFAMNGGIPSIPYINLGNPLTDNIWAKALSGGLWYSVGPSQMLNAPSLIPSVALMN